MYVCPRVLYYSSVDHYLVGWVALNILGCHYHVLTLSTPASSMCIEHIAKREVTKLYNRYKFTLKFITVFYLQA